ncbi:VTT domain-containing protein [Bacillus sp. SL00103]
MNKRKWLLFLVIAGLAVLLWWLNKQHLQLAPKDVKNWVLIWTTGSLCFLFLSLFRPFVLVPLTVFSLALGLAFGSVLGTIYASSVATAGTLGSFLLATTFRSKESKSSDRKLSGDIRIPGAWVSLHLLCVLPPSIFDFVSYAAATSRANSRAFTAYLFRFNTGYSDVNVLGSSFVLAIMPPWQSFV